MNYILEFIKMVRNLFVGNNGNISENKLHPIYSITGMLEIECRKCECHQDFYIGEDGVIYSNIKLAPYNITCCLCGDKLISPQNRLMKYKFNPNNGKCFDWDFVKAEQLRPYDYISEEKTSGVMLWQ